MAEGVLVFDESPGIAVEEAVEPTGRTLVVVGGETDVIVFEPDPIRESRELEGKDVLVFDEDQTFVETSTEVANLILMDPPAIAANVVLEDTLHDLLLVTPGGPPGARGEKGTKGDTGPQGEPGLDGPGAYYQEFGFATPVDIWTVVHNQGTYALSVETVDLYGEPVEGAIRYPDANTIEIDWFFPMAGTARIFR